MLPLPWHTSVGQFNVSPRSLWYVSDVGRYVLGQLFMACERLCQWPQERLARNEVEGTKTYYRKGRKEDIGLADTIWNVMPAEGGKEDWTNWSIRESRGIEVDFVPPTRPPTPPGAKLEES